MIVVKFGGSVLGEYHEAESNLKNILQTIRALCESNNQKLIIVLSAFKKVTRKLFGLSQALNFSTKQTDEILSYGEIFTCNVVEKFLVNSLPQNISCISLHNNFQSQQNHQDAQPVILTNDYFSQASIISVNTEMIQNLLSKHEIVIIPGFIGKNSHNDITTLGFEGSDITAITIAQNMNASECILFKDVGGCYSANPKSTNHTILYNHLHYDQAMLMAENSNILHKKCIEIAKQNNIVIKIQNYNMNSNLHTVIDNKLNNNFFYITSNLDKFIKETTIPYEIEIRLFYMQNLFENIENIKKMIYHEYFIDFINEADLSNGIRFATWRIQNYDINQNIQNISQITEQTKQKIHDYCIGLTK